MIYKYTHPEYFRDWDKPDFANLEKPLVLWGAGKIGGVADHCLKKRGINYAAFCDIAKDKWGTIFCEHEIISPDELQKRYPDAAVIITSVFYSSTYEMLQLRGYREIYDCTSLFMEIDFSDYTFWASKEYSIRNVEQCLAAILEQKTMSGRIDQIFLNITTKCSLRCRDCSLFIPYVSSPCNYCADDILSDLNKVIDSLQYVRIVNFYGGEPLLHPDLAQMIRSLKKEQRIDRISIISNGTIIPNKEVLLAMADEERFMVRLSDYKEHSPKIPEITACLEQYGIKYEIANYTYWDKQSKIGFTGHTKEELTAKFRLCTSCNVLFLINRKGYLCSTGSAVCNMGGFPYSPSNFIDLLDTENFSEKLINFITRPRNGEYMDACKYCSGNHCVQFEEKVPVAVQTKELLKFPSLTGSEG
ncbi:MAG: radical SAM protein [Oscillospiraceae bacterium]|nr:radical SAM protein [Oscillospiraceae bacterium]